MSPLIFWTDPGELEPETTYRALICLTPLLEGILPFILLLNASAIQHRRKTMGIKDLNEQYSSIIHCVWPLATGLHMPLSVRYHSEICIPCRKITGMMPTMSTASRQYLWNGRWLACIQIVMLRLQLPYCPLLLSPWSQPQDIGEAQS